MNKKHDVIGEEGGMMNGLNGNNHAQLRTVSASRHLILDQMANWLVNGEYKGNMIMLSLKLFLSTANPKPCDWSCLVFDNKVPISKPNHSSIEMIILINQEDAAIYGHTLYVPLQHNYILLLRGRPDEAHFAVNKMYYTALLRGFVDAKNEKCICVCVCC